MNSIALGWSVSSIAINAPSFLWWYVHIFVYEEQESMISKTCQAISHEPTFSLSQLPRGMPGDVNIPNFPYHANIRIADNKYINLPAQPRR